MEGVEAGWWRAIRREVLSLHDLSQRTVTGTTLAPILGHSQATVIPTDVGFW